MSPYLFLMCANILSLTLLKAKQNHDIMGVELGRNGLSFTHLFFVDDSLLFFRNNAKSLATLRTTLEWYCILSGQKNNLDKSDLFCSLNMSREDQESLASQLQVNFVVNPSKYLGVNFKLSERWVADFHYLVEKLQSKLQGWKAKLLSQAGRTTLISSVLQSMPLYTFSCFRVPDTVRDKLDATTRAFWWGHDPGTRKLHLINWNEVCKPRREGGLGLKKFKLMNQAMLAKQFWGIAYNPQSLLARTLKGKYYPRGSIHDCSPKPHNSWIWRNIIKSKKY